MNPKKDYYKILGIPATATTEEIQRAYKKLAFQFHPNRHAKKSDEEKAELSKKFQEIHKAFKCLSDPTKRENYDKYGTEEDMEFSQHSFNDIFANLFGNAGKGEGGFSFFESMGGGSSFGNGFMGQQDGGHFFNMSQNMGKGSNFSNASKRSQQPTVRHTEHHLQCTLEEYHSGAQKKLKIRRNTLRMGVEEHIITVHVLPGYKKGTKITYDDMGDECQPGVFGNFIVILDEKEEALKREGDDIVSEVVYDSYKEFCDGETKTVALPGNRTATVRGCNVKLIGGFITLMGYGMSKRKGGCGDLKVRILVRNDK